MYHRFTKVCAGQLWDVAFAVQAILACNIAEEYRSTLKKAHDFIKASQVLLSKIEVILTLFLLTYLLNSTNLNFKIMDNPSGDFSRKYRHISKGGWGFQVADQGWQVSDCTAEALKVQHPLSPYH
jgi:cycloartenol synthase